MFIKIGKIVVGLALVLILVDIAVLILYGTQFGHWAKVAVGFPYELDYGEGPILSQTMAIMKGHTIYDNPSKPPYTIGNYPPLYHYAAGLLGLMVKPNLAAGRLLSSLATVGIALFIGLIVYGGGKKTPVKTGCMLAAAATGALTFLTVKPVFQWGVFMRVDMLAILFSIAGVWAYLRWGGHGKKAYIPVLLFLAAAYTKQSTIAGAAACLITALICRPKEGIRLTAAFAAAGLGIMALVSLLTGGSFYYHLVTANANFFSWDTVANFMGDLWRQHWILIVLAICEASVCIRDLVKTRLKDGGEKRLAIVLFLLFSFLVSLTVGKVGSSVNYLIEFMSAVCICMGILIGDLLQRVAGFTDGAEGQGEKGKPDFAGLSNASIWALAVPILIFGQLRLLDHTPGERDWVRYPDYWAWDKGQKAVELIKNVHGPVISEEMTLLALAGKPIVFQPFELTQLSYQGIWDQTPLVRDIEGRKYPLILLEFDIWSDPSWRYTRFSPEVLQAIRDNYANVATYGDLVCYTPY